jgi:hypothetical protein
MATSSGATPPPPPNKPKIVITAEEMASPEVTAVVNHIQAAQQVPLVREVGTAGKSFGGLLTLLWLSLAGIVGGFFTWMTWNLLPETEDTTASNIQASMSIALVIGLVLVLVDSGQSRSWPKVGRALAIAAPVGLVLSLILGFVTNTVYGSLVDATYEKIVAAGFDPGAESFWTEFANQNHLNRGIAWSLIGLAAGLTVGITTLAIKRILVTGAGGLVGGFLGGFLFDFFQGEAAAQIVGLCVTGLAIGVSIGLMEQATKSSWLEIVQGGMAGKQFILYKHDITIGSSPSADVTLIKDPSIPGIAATISRRGSQVFLVSTDPQRPVSVDGAAVIKGLITEGSSIALGATIVRFRERSKNSVNSGIVRS